MIKLSSALFYAFLVAAFQPNVLISSFSLYPFQQEGGNQTNQTVPGGNVTQVNGTIVDYLNQNSNISILMNSLNETMLLQGMNSTNLTLFAPNNQAFETLPKWITEHARNVSNSGALPAVQAFLLYHVHLGNDVKPKNWTSGQNQTQSQWLSPWTGGPSQGAQNQTSSNSTSVSTVMRPLNLTLYKNQQGQFFVNDAQVLSVANTTNGYVYELDKVVTSWFYFNMSIYNMTQAPPQLPSNYTFPSPAPPVPFNFTQGGSQATMEAYDAEDVDWFGWY